MLSKFADPLLIQANLQADACLARTCQQVLPRLLDMNVVLRS